MEGKYCPSQVRFLTYRKTIDILSTKNNPKYTSIRIWEDLPKEINEEMRSSILQMKKIREVCNNKIQ